MFNTRGRRATSRRMLLAVAGVCALTAVGCGSSGSGDSTSSKTTSASKPKCGDGTGKAATGKPIAVGGMATLSGGSQIPGGAAGARAYFECLNANGGIGGRPVQYDVVDDGLDPAKAARGAAELLNDKSVVAVVGSSSYLECAVAGPIYAKAGVLELEAGGAAAQCYTSPNITSVAMSSILTNIGTVQYGVEEQGAKRIAVLSPNVPGLGEAVIAGVERYAKSAGVEVVYTALYKPGIKDATSLLLAAAQKNPDFIEVSAVPQDATTIFDAAQSQDMKSRFKWGCPSPCHAPEFADSLDSYWDGAVSVGMPLASFDADTPDNAQWRAVMEAYAPDDEQDQFSQSGFLSAKIFADTVAKMPADQIDRAGVSQALKGIKGYRNDIMCGDFYWPSGPVHIVNHASRYATVEDKSFKQVKDCTEVADPQLAPVLSAESKG